MAALQSLLEMLEENDNTEKLEEIMEVVYEPYVILDEFVRRSCKGSWWNPPQ